MLQNHYFNKIRYNFKDFQICSKFLFKDFNCINLNKLALDLFSAMSFLHRQDFSLNGCFNINDIYFEVCTFFNIKNA